MLMISTMAMAVMPFAKFTTEGSTDFNVALDKSRKDIQIFAPDADIKFSVWRYYGDEWNIIYPAFNVNSPAVCDSQYVAFAGVPFKIVDGGKADVICIDRTDVTSVQVIAK